MTNTVSISEPSQKNALRYLHLPWLLALWGMQYLLWGLWAISVKTWRFTVAFFKVALTAGFLVWIPIIGWAMIAVYAIRKIRAENKWNLRLPSPAFKHLLDI